MKQMSGNRPKGLVWTPIFDRTFYWAPVGFPCPIGGMVVVETVVKI